VRDLPGRGCCVVDVRRRRRPTGQNGRVATRTDDARSAGRGAFALLIFQSLARLLALAFIIVATREVTPSEFGRYSTVAAVLLIVGFVSDLGTTAATTKLVSTGKDADELLSDSLLACLALGFAAWGVGEIAVVVIYPHLLALDFAILGASLPFDACLTTVLGALDGSGASTWRALVSFARGGLAAVIATALVVATSSIRWSLVGLVAGPCIALVLAVSVSRHLGVWRGHLRLSLRRGWPLIVAAVPFAAISGFSVVTARVDVVVVSIVSSRGTTAAYDLAVRVLEGPLFLTTVLYGPMMYLFSRRLADGDQDGAQRVFDQVMRLLFVGGIAVSVLLATLSRQLVTALFGASYPRADLLVVILGAQLWLMFVCAIQGMVLASMPQMRRVVGLVAFVNTVQIVVQVCFIVVGGPVGGALSYAFGTIFAMIAFGMFIRRTVGIETMRLPPWGTVVGAGAAAAAAFALRHAPVEIPLAVGSFVYLVAVVVSRSVGRSDVTELRDLLRRR